MADETFAEKLIGKALRTYSEYADRSTMPTNRRMFLESVIDKRKDPITETAFKPEELTALSDLVAQKYSELPESVDQYAAYLEKALTRHDAAVKAKDRDKIMYPEFAAQYKKDLAALKAFKSKKLTQEFLDLASGAQTYERKIAMNEASRYGKDIRSAFNVRPYITYADYHQTPGEIAATHTTWSRDPKSMLRTTLGQFRYAVDPETGGLVVTDKYDFNPPKGFLGLGPTTAPAPVGEWHLAEGNGGGLYGTIRQYAGRVMPPGTGRSVRVQTNALAPSFRNVMAE